MYEDSTVKFEKWNFLPPELKREVMKKLNFNDIWSIRRTASAEHALANTLKPKFSKVDVITNRVHIYETDNPFKKSKSSFDLIYIIRPNLRHDSPFDLFKWICHHALIENMEIMGDRVPHLLMNLLKETTRQFSVNNLKLNDVNGAEINFYLSKMDSKLETIRIGCSCRSFDKLIDIRSVVNARYIQIAESTSRSCAILLAQKWIDNDAKVDRVFETMVYKKGAFERFVEEFTSRIVYKTAKNVKIRTDNPKKHIKLELGIKSDHWKCRRKQNQEFIRLSVVRADQEDKPEDEREQPWMPELEDLQFRRDLITKSPFR
ncbi:hypothetical protein CAEBREN_28237 [Caenorhabditis brenneri]|uniref:F-box domain-containing protein n=1 Tax=Caenorhabditis brenneri TaxID=135651 RepID=G0MD90_CAEBE|nr:hypothetical protein CAEBREN_28237 [Caenorhabditis brenneri]